MVKYKRARIAKYITAIVCGLLFLVLYSAASSAIDTATTIRFFIALVILGPLMFKGVGLLNWFDDAQERNRKILEKSGRRESVKTEMS